MLLLRRFIFHNGLLLVFFFFFFFNDTATTEIYTLSLHDALPIWSGEPNYRTKVEGGVAKCRWRSEEHTSELQSRLHLVCRLLLEKKKRKHTPSDSSQNVSIRSRCTRPKTRNWSRCVI